MICVHCQSEYPGIHEPQHMKFDNDCVHFCRVVKDNALAYMLPPKQSTKRCDVVWDTDVVCPNCGNCTDGTVLHEFKGGYCDIKDREGVYIKSQSALRGFGFPKTAPRTAEDRMDIEPKTTADKEVADKPRYDLVDAYALHQLALVYSFGAKKYKPHNWRKGMDWSVAFAALCRHSWAWFRGQDMDEESGLSHMAHAAFWCFALVWYGREGKGKDDRTTFQ